MTFRSDDLDGVALYNAWVLHDGQVRRLPIHAMDDASALQAWEVLLQRLPEKHCEAWLLTPLGRQLARRRSRPLYQIYITDV